MRTMLRATPSKYRRRIATPQPALPFTMEPSPGMNNERITASAGFFGATTAGIP